ncbi:hypothetical protein ACFRMN_07445 [Streptomyces sp. NPDC056835]
MELLGVEGDLFGPTAEKDSALIAALGHAVLAEEELAEALRTIRMLKHPQ